MLQAPVHEEGSNFERVVDIGHGAHHALELLEKEDTFGSHALGVGVGVGSLYLGLNQLARSSNTLDRIEGVGHLALAGESFTGLVPSLEHSSLHTGLGLVHGASELVTGAGEFLAARKQNNRRDQAAGVAQFLTGMAVVVESVVPKMHTMAAATILGGIAIRQALMGLPKSPGN